MSEPLTDEEIEMLNKKTMLLTPWTDKAKYIYWFDRLLATVKSLKDKLKIADEAGMAWIKLCDKRKEENAKLKECLDMASCTERSLKEENAKLRKPSKNDRRQHDLNYAARAPERRHR